MKKLILFLSIIITLPTFGQIKLSQLTETTTLNTNDLFLVSKGTASRKLQFTNLRYSVLNPIPFALRMNYLSDSLRTYFSADSTMFNTNNSFFKFNKPIYANGVLLGTGGGVTPIDGPWDWQTNKYNYYADSTGTGSVLGSYLGTQDPEKTTRVNFNFAPHAAKYTVIQSEGDGELANIYPSFMQYKDTDGDINSSISAESFTIYKATTPFATYFKANPNVTNGATAKAYILSTKENLITTGAKIISFENQGVEKAYIDKDGIGKFKTLRVDTLATGTLIKGETRWNDTDKCLETYLGNGVTVQNNNEVPIYVQNNTGSTIPAGKLVYFIAAGGETPRITLADATYHGTSRGTIGMTTSSISHGGNGFVTTFGKVHDLNTSGQEGLDAYLTTSGNYTTTRPSNGHIVKVGTIPYGHSSNGIFFVKIEKETSTYTAVLNNNASSGIVTDTINGIRLLGTTTVYNDLMPNAVSLGQGVSVPAFSIYNGSVLRAYEFVGNALNVREIFMAFQLPHLYKEGSNIGPHVHIYIPDDATGGIIKFGVTLSWNNVNATGTDSETTYYGTITRTANQGINNNAILSFGSIDGTGKTLSSIVSCRIFRDAGDSGDTFGGSVWLKAADIHYEIDALGSSTETAK